MEEIKATCVIVGGGIAGVSCAEGLSFLQPDIDVILITSTYVIKSVTNIVNLTKTLSQFDVEECRADSFSKLYPSISIVYDTVNRIDPENLTLYTEGGKCIRYQKLCICTGAQPKLFAETHPCIIGLRDTESVSKFQERLVNAKKILVVGNGGIATEIVHEIDGVEIIWVIKDKHISATFVDAGAAEFFQTKLMKKKDKDPEVKTATTRMRYTVASSNCNSNKQLGSALGPDWHTNFDIHGSNLIPFNIMVEYECEIEKVFGMEKSFGAESWPVYAELTNGKVIGCDLIISATGVTPDTTITQSLLDIADDGGLVVNWRMETSDPNVFAAGDVATTSWEKAKHWFQMRLWTQARQMGLYSAKCMVASLTKEPVLQDFCFEMFSHVTKFFGYKVVLLGLYNGQTLGGEYDILLRMTKGVEYIKLVMKDGKIHGAVLIGNTDLEEMCENLILNQLDVSAFGEDLLNPGIDIEDFFD